MRRAAALAPLLAPLLVLAGCGGGSVVAPPSGPPASELRIGMVDYRFQLSAAELRAGPVTVVATNAGSSEHDVVLTEDGAELGRSGVLAPGAQQTFQVDVVPGGPVRLECSLPGHSAAGMRATVGVAVGPDRTGSAQPSSG